MVEHEEQIEAIVYEAIRAWGQDRSVARGGQGGPAAFVQMWSEVRCRLRTLGDTATSLAEDKQTALRLLYRLEMTSEPAGSEVSAD